MVLHKQSMKIAEIISQITDNTKGISNFVSVITLVLLQDGPAEIVKGGLIFLAIAVVTRDRLFDKVLR